MDGLLPAAGPIPAIAQIDEWERQLDEIGEPLPAVELGLRWLRANAPEPAEPRLVHGDFRLGNFIVDEEGLAAVIDWELAHLGDPAEDIGWLCIRSWRFGNDDQPVAGVGQLDEFIAAYEAAGGAPVDRERLRYWEAFGNAKWAIICARQAHDHLTGVRRSHELGLARPADLRAGVGPAGADSGERDAGQANRRRAARVGRRVPVRRACGRRCPREQRFKVLVAANVCAVVAREHRAGERPDRQDLALFSELLGEEAEESTTAAAELSERLRVGELDDRIDELVAPSRGACAAQARDRPGPATPIALPEVTRNSRRTPG